MQLTEDQKQLAEQLGELLGESPIDDKLKEIIINNLGKLPEHLVIRLVESLENEKEELEKVLTDIKIFLREQDQDWQDLEEDQKNYAEEFIENSFKRLEEEAGVEN